MDDLLIFNKDARQTYHNDVFKSELNNHGNVKYN